MNVYLFRIHDRPYGFRVVAVVEPSLNDAKAVLVTRWRVNFNEDRKHIRPYAELIDECVTQDGQSVQMEYEE